MTPLQEEFLRRQEAGTMTAYRLAKLVGWECPRAGGRRGTRPDDSRVRNALGLKQYNPGRGYPPRFRTQVREETALKLAEAMHLDPVDVGL